jgi:hypothetical protein
MPVLLINLTSMAMEQMKIVVEMTGYENEEFGVYRRQNGFWKQVHVGGEGGC